MTPGSLERKGGRIPPFVPFLSFGLLLCGGLIVWQSNSVVRPITKSATAPVNVRREYVDDLPQPLAIFPTVFWEPRDTESLRAAIRAADAVQGKTVLEIGTGSGLVALCCLKAGAARVVVTDVNPSALACAKYNADQFGWSDRMETRLVDRNNAGAFAKLADGERFDIIISNPPWEDALPARIDDYALYDPGFALLDSLLTGAQDHLEVGGHMWLAYGAVAAIERIVQTAPAHTLSVSIRDERDIKSLPPVFLPGVLLELRPPSSPP